MSNLAKITKSKSWYKIKSLIPQGIYEPLLSIYYFINRSFYYGNNVTCPICENNFKKFQGESCPKCGSSSRHRALWLFLKRKTDFFERDLKLLHFAPEHCFYKKLRDQKNINYTTGDICSPRAIAKIDITNINYPDNSFDVIISSHVLEHVPNDCQAMKELSRVQKSDGWAIHLVPIDHSREKTYDDPLINTPEKREKIYGHHDHKRIYGLDYTKRLEINGFKPHIFKVIDYINENEILKFGLDPNIEICYCQKK
jgi:SAM-dependent methyltransferase